MIDYEAYDGLGLAALVRSGDVTAAELVEEAISRIERENPALNAVIFTDYESARARAAAPLDEAPFAGVPFLLKDMTEAVAGWPSTYGSRLLKNNIATSDTETVRRYKRAGFISLGKTATSEFGILPVTEGGLWEPARNPWNLERTPGGSSGGSAAAVAAGMVPIASGSDGGGSLRIPASACGLFALKPTRGRTPTGPVEVEYWAGSAIDHVLTRSVRDSAAVLDAIQGPEAGALYATRTPDRPFLEEVGRPPGRLRIAISTEPPIPADVHPDCILAAESAALLCEQLGHEVVEARPEIDGAALARDFLIMVAGETAGEIREAEAALGRRAGHDDLDPATLFLKMMGDKIPAGEFARAVRDLHRTSRTVSAFFAEHDVLLTPTLAQPPVPIGSVTPSPRLATLVGLADTLHAGGLLRALHLLEEEAKTTFDFTPFTPLFNASGHPAMSVPLYWNAEGLPIGVQFVADLEREALLLSLAGHLEEARPWFDRRPPKHGGGTAS